MNLLADDWLKNKILSPCKSIYPPFSCLVCFANKIHTIPCFTLRNYTVPARPALPFLWRPKSRLHSMKYKHYPKKDWFENYHVDVFIKKVLYIRFSIVLINRWQIVSQILFLPINHLLLFFSFEWIRLLTANPIFFVRLLIIPPEDFPRSIFWEISNGIFSFSKLNRPWVKNLLSAN